MPRDLQNVTARVEALKVRRPGAYQLARVLSLAARIEFPLLRRARQLLPNVDASAEADLCASEIVASQTPQGFMFDTSAADVLRRDLAGDAGLLERAWHVVSVAHRDAPWPVRSEEHINRLSLSSDPADADRIQQILLAGAREMVESNDRVGAARWMMRALARLPPGAGESEAGRAIEAGVAVQLDRRLDLDAANLPADAFENWFPWLLPRAGPSVDVAVSLLDGFLELGRSDAIGTIAIPDTKPLIVDVSWHDGLHARAERVTFEKTEWRQVRITSQDVELRSLDGRRYRVRARADDVTQGGIDFSAIRARHRPFVGRAKELDELNRMLPPSGSEHVAIVGEPGIGKTALLCRFLDQLEERGARVIVHFVEGGPDAWRRPETIEASLRAQMAHWPSASSSRGSDVHLIDELNRHAWSNGIYILLDGFDSERDAALSRWRSELTTSPARSVSVVWTESRRSATGVAVVHRARPERSPGIKPRRLPGVPAVAWRGAQPVHAERSAQSRGRQHRTPGCDDRVDRSADRRTGGSEPDAARVLRRLRPCLVARCLSDDRGAEAVELTAAVLAAVREPIMLRDFQHLVVEFTNEVASESAAEKAPVGRPRSR